VIGAVGSSEKVDAARAAGADQVIVHTSEPLSDGVRHVTSGGGADLVFDSVGKATIEESVNSLAPFGRLVVFGQASGSLPDVALDRVFFQNIAILGYSGGPYRRRHPTATRRAARHIFDLIRDGTLRIRIGLRLPLPEASEAHRRLELGSVVGKVLLIP
jgi:NADPH2:quinone reductase